MFVVFDLMRQGFAQGLRFREVSLCSTVLRSLPLPLQLHFPPFSICLALSPGSSFWGSLASELWEAIMPEGSERASAIVCIPSMPGSWVCPFRHRGGHAPLAATTVMFHHPLLASFKGTFACNSHFIKLSFSVPT